MRALLAAGNWHLEFIADALAEQGTAERRIHAEVTRLAVELVRPDDAVTPRASLASSIVTQAPKNARLLSEGGPATT